MCTMAYTVAQNTSFMTVASILQKAVSFVYFTVIARLIGVENTGVYFFAIAFTTIFAVFADFGFNSVLTRESAKYPEQTERYLSTVLAAKLLFSLVSYALLALSVNVLHYSDLTRHLIYLAGITMVLDNFHTVFYGVFRGRRNLVYEGIGIVGAQFLTLVVGSLALYNHWSLIWLILAYTIASALNVIYTVCVARSRFHLRWSFSFDKQIFKMFFIFAVPLALAGLIGRFYAYSDSLLMSKMLTAQELGWWSVPYKIAFAFQFVPIALSASVYPAMSAFAERDREKIGELFTKSWRYLFTIVFPLSFGLIALARPALVFLYGANYLPAAPALQILMASLIFGFLAFVTGALLNATNHQKTQTGLMTLVLAVNIVLNLILLPRLGIYGAAVAALASNFVLCAGGLIFSNYFVKLDFTLLFKYFLQTFIPAAVMGILVYYFSRHLHFIFTIPIGVIIYALLLFISGGMSLTLFDTIRQKVWRH